ncbi:hypothetical protein GX411_06800 [Candidatus Fermentibacteria bacterium]|nr:hypothetical protein [Candidatus Fermentibacteria bacterium]
MTALHFAVLASLAGAFEPSPQDLLETGLCFEWSELPLMGSAAVLVDGEPGLLFGDCPLPPWGSFSSARVAGPLEAGIWAGGRWSLEFSTEQVPDSSFDSTAGLLENTRDRNRYSGSLRRPLPGGLGFSGILAREDTISSQMVLLDAGPLEAGGWFWQRSTDGGAAWLAAGTGGFRGRAGLAMRRTGVHMWEARAAQEASSGILSGQLAASLTGADTVTSAGAHFRISVDAGALDLVARIDGSWTSDSLATGWVAGPSAGIAGFSVSVCARDPQGSDGIEGILTAERGFAGAEVVLDGGGAAAGAHLTGPLATAASLLYSADSTRIGLTAMPGLRWGASGILKFGGRMSAVHDGDGGWSEALDLISSFSIGRFSLVGAAEDVTDDQTRRYSYGMIWAFSDGPRSAEREGRGGEGG